MKNLIAMQIEQPKPPTYEALQFETTVLSWELQVHKEALEKVCKEHNINMENLLHEIANQSDSEFAE